MILHSCDDYKVSLITKKQTKYTRKYVKSLQHDLRKKKQINSNFEGENQNSFKKGCSFWKTVLDSLTQKF